MKRWGMFALVAAVAATGGCASSAKYVDHSKPDMGVVAIPDNSDSWPNGNRRAALELIEKHVGPNYEIVEERTVPTGRTATRTPLPDTNESLNPRNQASPVKRPTGMAATRQEEVTEYRITYRKKAGGFPAPRELASQEETGLTPAGGTIGPARDLPRPSAGGPISLFNRNTVQPAGGADCNH